MSGRTRTIGWLTLLLLMQTTVIGVGFFFFLRPSLSEQEATVRGFPRVASAKTQFMEHPASRAYQKTAVDPILGGHRRSEPVTDEKVAISVESPRSPNDSMADADPDRSFLSQSETPAPTRHGTEPPVQTSDPIASGSDAESIPDSALLSDAADPLISELNGPSKVSVPATAVDRNAIASALEDAPPAQESSAPEPQGQFIIPIRHGKASEIARTIRELFGASIKVAADDNSQSVIVIASEATRDKIDQLVNTIDQRAAELESERQAAARNNAQQLTAEETNETSMPYRGPRRADGATVPPRQAAATPPDPAAIIKLEAALKHDQINVKNLIREWGPTHPKTREIEQRMTLTKQWLDEHQQNPKRTLLLTPVGRSPTEIAKRLTRNYGDVSKVTVHELTGNVLISINPAESPAVAREYLLEMQHAANQVAAAPNVAAAITSGFPADDQDTAMDREARQLAAKIRAAKPDDRAALRKELEALTVKQFDHRQQRRQHEFEQLSQRVDRLKANHQRRQEHRAEVIDRRVNELLDPSADLRWDETEPVDNTLVEERDTGPKNQIAKNPPLPTTAKLGPPVDISRIPAGESEAVTEFPLPTFNGVTLLDWFRLLETERSTDKVAEAVNAMNALREDADPRRLVRATLKMLRTQGSESFIFSSPTSTIMTGSTNLLKNLPAKIVVEELVTEATNSESRGPIQHFFLHFLRSINPQATANDPLRREIRHRSRTLVHAFSAAAERDHDLDLWAVACSSFVLNLSQQPITTYPELIPVAERVLAQADDFKATSFDPHKQPYLAASLLGRANLHVDDVYSYAERLWSRAMTEAPSTQNQTTTDSRLTRAASCLVAIAPFSLGARDLLHENLKKKWNDIVEYSKQEKNRVPAASSAAPVNLEQTQWNNLRVCVLLMSSLGETGHLGSNSIPLLHEIAKSPYAAVETGPGYFPSSQFSQKPKTLQDYATDTINSIQTPKPAPEVVPLEDEEPSGQLSRTNSSDNSVGQTKSDEPRLNGAAHVETTYDGITYSQWLKLLETERKPDKLIAAIDTCARLAAKGDERKITRLILQAERFFESDKWQDDRRKAAEAGYASLSELPGEIVIDELVAALTGPSSTAPAQSFEIGYFNQSSGLPHADFVRQRATELIAALLKRVPPETTPETYVTMAAASTVWRSSNRPLIDFDGLTSRIHRMLDAEPDASQLPAMYYWLRVMDNLVNQAPATPDLALKLIKHAQKYGSGSDKIISLFPSLQQYAAPAVPGLVELFLSESKKVSPDAIAFGPLSSEPAGERVRISIINVLGDFDSGDLGYALLQQVAVTTSDPNDRERQLMARGRYTNQIIIAAKDSLKKLATKRGPPPEGTLKSDFLALSDVWKLKGIVPVDSDPAGDDGIQVRIRLNEWRWTSLHNHGRSTFGTRLANFLTVLDTRTSQWQMTVDETTSPRQITLFAMPQPGMANARAGILGGGPRNPEVPLIRWEGIYDLNGQTLMIQLAKPEHPRPTEFCKDSHDLPAHEFLLELVRETPRTE